MASRAISRGGQSGGEGTETGSGGEGNGTSDGGEDGGGSFVDQGTCPEPQLTCTEAAFCAQEGGIEESEFTCGGNEVCCDLDPPKIVAAGDPCEPGEANLCGENDGVLECIGGVWTAAPCEVGSVCCQGTCAPSICTPYTEKACVDAKTVAVCNDCGTVMVEQPCAGTYYCDPVTFACQCEVGVKVLFLLDASGSMGLNMVGNQTRWEVAQATIESVMADYPHFRYGLMSFPNAPVTCNGPGCEGEAGCAESFTSELNAPIDTPPETISEYLKNRELAGPGGDLELVLTPLFGAMDFLVNDYSGPLKDMDGTPTYVIVISDGQDTCHAPFYPELTVGPWATWRAASRTGGGFEPTPSGLGWRRGVTN